MEYLVDDGYLADGRYQADGWLQADIFQQWMEGGGTGFGMWDRIWDMDMSPAKNVQGLCLWQKKRPKPAAPVSKPLSWVLSYLSIPLKLV